MKLMVEVRGYGSFSVALFPHLAPIACERVTRIARLGRYNNRRIERLEPDFVLQPLFFDGDDPLMDEAVALEAKTVPENGQIRFERGTVAMAGNAVSASAAQYFVTLKPVERLNGCFTVIGKVADGWQTIEKLERVRVAEGVLREGDKTFSYHYPEAELIINRVTVEE